MIIIMFNSVNQEILNHHQTEEIRQQRLQLPSLSKAQKIKIPINYIKQYFESKALINIPHITIAGFYQKIHKIRSIFINQTPNPKQFLVKEYRINVPVSINDNLIHNSHQIIQRMQSLQKQKFIYQEDLDYKKTKRIYFGEMVLGKKQGYGIYAQYQSKGGQQNGSHFYFYQGFFSQNNKNGLGVQWSNNRIFIGQFVNNAHFSHSQAIFLYNNGDIFIGSIFNYKRNGRGVLFQSKARQNQYYKYQTSQKYGSYQSIIVGYWQNDEISRKNKFSLTTKFKEIFQMNLYDYSSNLIIKATSIYVGDIKKIEGNLEQTQFKEMFIKQGKGFQYFCNGDIYKGQYLSDKPHGFGHYIWDNKDEYQGQFMKGFREGTGKWSGSNGQQFQGQYQKDTRNGYGVYKWPNGNIYEGEFKNDNRHGVGKMSWSNGQTYLGKWKNGLQHGKGEVRAHLYSFNIRKQLIFDKGRPANRTQKSDTKKKEKQQQKSHLLRKQSYDKKRMSLVETKNYKIKNKFGHKKGHIKSEITQNIKQIHYQNKSQQQLQQEMIILDDDIPAHTQNIQQHISQKELYKIEHSIKSSSKIIKKQKFKLGSITNKKDQLSKLGQTLLKPIKWTNFKQSWHRP